MNAASKICPPTSGRLRRTWRDFLPTSGRLRRTWRNSILPLSTLVAFFAAGCAEDVEIAEPHETVAAHGDDLTQPSSTQNNQLYAGNTQTAAACDSGPGSDGADKLALVGVVSGSSSSCQTTMKEVFTGATLADVPSSTPWNGRGGAGKLSAEALLCLLRDLRDAPIRQTVPLKHGVKGTLEIQVTGFDPVSLSVYGYRRMFVTLPALGEVSTRPQMFEGRVVYTPTFSLLGATPPSAGSIPITGSYALRISAEDESRAMDVTPPSVMVPTPYGTFSAAPKFHYDQQNHVELPATSNATVSQHSDDVMSWGGIGADMYDVAGRGPGRGFVDAHDEWGTGWTSFASLGSRGPYAPWTGTGERPDLELHTPRTDAERTPGTTATASIAVGIDAAGLLPPFLQSSPVHTEFSITVTPSVSAKLWSQLHLSAGEAVMPWVDTSDLSGSSFGADRIQAALTAQSILNLSVTFRLFVKLNFWPVNKTLINVNETWTRRLDSSSDSSDQLDKPAASLTWSARQTPVRTYAGTSMTTPSGDVVSAAAHVAACLAKPAEVGTVPQGSYTPGDVGDLLDEALWPCNICINTPPSTGTVLTPNGAVSQTVPGYYALLTPSENGPAPDWSCAASMQHSGCHDMCKMTIDANGTKHVVRTISATIVDPAKCADVIQ